MEDLENKTKEELIEELNKITKSQVFWMEQGIIWQNKYNKLKASIESIINTIE